NIVPVLGTKKVSELTYEDIDKLHARITRDGTIKPKSGKRRGKGASYKANRTLAVLSKMLNLAVKWQMRADNPVKGIERNQELKRNRYLSSDELARLTAALAEHKDQQAANILRLLMLTGARRGEVQSARWDQFDAEPGKWIKPAASTKQKMEHRIPLSAPAQQ